MNPCVQYDLTTSHCMQIEQLRSTGVEPFAYSFGVSHTAAELQQTYQDLPNGELADLDGSPIAVAGRIMTRRFLGKKLAFFTLQDALAPFSCTLRKVSWNLTLPCPLGEPLQCHLNTCICCVLNVEVLVTQEHDPDSICCGL